MPAETRELVAEFLGTYVLILTVGCNVLGGSGLWAATSIAFSLMVMIYALANVSGANFNPAVSVTLALTNQMDWAKAGAYSVAQIVGGLAAGGTYALLFGEAFNLEPAAGYHWAAAAAAEVIYTFFLTFTVLCTAVLKGAAEKEFFGYAIGSTVIAGGYAVGAISGGCFNPAVALGVDTASAGLGFGWSLAYVGFELIGAALAAIFFKVAFPGQFGNGKESGNEAYLAEFIGTFMLSVTVLFAVATGAPAAALSIGAALAVSVYNTYTISADLNPAVTLAAFTVGSIKGEKQDVTATALKIASQLAGAVAAAACVIGVLGAGKLPNVAPGAGFSLSDALAAEFVFTFVLCSVVVNIVEQLPALVPALGLSVGGVIVAGGNAVGKVSGAAFNPAVAVAVQTAAGGGAAGWANVGSYAAVEVLGGVAAAGALAAMRSDSFAVAKKA